MIRTPRGVGLLKLDPYPYSVLWSHNITPAQVAAFNRLNPKLVGPQDLDRGNCTARTYWTDRYAWLVFFERPTWESVIHECCHAVGACFRYIEATGEVHIGGEVEAYLLGHLAARVGADLKASPRVEK